jgi:NAD(P)H-hydrate epimerase
MSDPISLPAVTSEQMKEVERLMGAQYHIGVPALMENAGRSLALLAKRMLDGSVEDRAVVLLAGRGVHGGCGLAAARHLFNWGSWVQVVCAFPAEQFEGEAAEQVAALRAMGAPLAWAEEGWELPPADLVVDAISGYGVRGDPRGKTRELIQLANSSAAPILSLDVPSGVDSNDGRCYTPHIRAAATLALGLPKIGMLRVPARSACGRIFVADIGIPSALYAGLNLQVAPIFALDPVVELSTEGDQVWVNM